MLNLNIQQYLDWDVGAVFKIADRGNYAYRVTLVYEDGKKQIQQKSGFSTRKEAEEAKYRTISELVNKTYVVNARIKFSDFLKYWLENDIRKRVRSSNTYESYRNIVNRHIVPFLGNKKLEEIHKGDVLGLYKDRAEYSVSCVRQVKVVMNVSLSFALRHSLIQANPEKGVRLPKTVAKKPYHIKNIDSSKTLTMEQMDLLLDASKGTLIHMQVLFNVLMGLRKSEINGLKYSDVDYINRTIAVERQLGKELKRSDGEDTGLPDIRWHDLRSTYCTLLLKEGFNPKAVSKLMGHAHELVAVDVYGDKRNIVDDDIPELLSFMEDVMPKGREVNDTDGKKADLLDIVIDMSDYLVGSEAQGYKQLI